MSELGIAALEFDKNIVMFAVNACEIVEKV